MAELSTAGDTQWLNISFNPSSWMADCFVKFYQLHEKENLHCQAHTGKMREVLERIHEYKDELGFLYVTTRQQTDLQYLLVRKQLEFVPLKELDTCLYPGGGHLQKEGKPLTQEEIQNLHYIQNFLEDASNYEGWKLDTDDNLALGKIDVSVVTNSDYIMEKCWITETSPTSAVTLSPQPKQNPDPSIRLTYESSKITFGYVKRENTPLTPLAETFLTYIKQELTEE